MISINILKTLSQHKDDFNKRANDVNYEDALCHIVSKINPNDVLEDLECANICKELLVAAPDKWTKFKNVLTIIMSNKSQYDIPITTNSILRNINIMSLADICTITNNYPNMFSSEASKIILGYYIPSYKTEIHREYISYIFMGMVLCIPKSILAAAKLSMPAKKYYENLYTVLHAHFGTYETPRFSKNTLMNDVLRALCGKECNRNCTMIQYIKNNIPMSDIYNINPGLLSKSEKTICEINNIVRV